MSAYFFIFIKFLFGILIVGIPIVISYIVFKRLKKTKFKKYAFIFPTVIGLIMTILAIGIIFEDQLFSKNDALKLLAEQDISLTDNFLMVENKSMSAIGDYYHTFTLAISLKDKQTIVNKIKNSPNFKGLNENIEDLLRSTEDRYTGKKLTQNYESVSQFVREYYKPNGQGYAPTYRKIVIDKKKNELTFEDIDE